MPDDPMGESLPRFAPWLFATGPRQRSPRLAAAKRRKNAAHRRKPWVGCTEKPFSPGGAEDRTGGKADRWPIQAWCWLEWGSSTAGHTLPTFAAWLFATGPDRLTPLLQPRSGGRMQPTA